MRRDGVSGATRGGIPRLPERTDYELSFGQQRLWFLEQLVPGSPAYNIPFAGRLHGPLDVAVLQRAVDEVVRRHEILRTSFPTVEGRPVQRVAPAPRTPVEIDDLTSLPEDAREESAGRIVDGEARVPFDLACGPVLRVRLVRLAREDHLLLVTMPHIVTDAWSMAVFFRELPALYDAFAEDRPSPLPDLPIQFRDFATWQREQVDAKRTEELLEHWKARLEGAPTVLDLPADRPRPAAQTFRGARATVDLPVSSTRGLEALAKREGATPFMAYLAAFGLLLWRWSGRDDLLVGSPVATREPEETHGLIGFFINTLVFRTRVHGTPTFRDLLHRVRESCLDAYAHQDLPFERLVEALGLERDLGRAPLTQATLVLQNVHIPSPEFRHLRLASFQQTGTRTAKFDLMLGLWESDHGVEGWWEYSTDLFDEETIGLLSARFRTLLRAIVEDPDRPIRELPLLPEEERRTLEGWSSSPEPYPREESLRDLFQRCALERPSSIALSGDGPDVSYGELNRRANRLAHHLRRLGVGDEAPVAILLPRSSRAVETVLGIVKAGGAYVPLDPADPPARIERLLVENGCRWIVTDTHGVRSLGSKTAEAALLDLDSAAHAGESDVDPPWPIDAEQLAYVMFTSGSTGTPKGVAVPHRAVARLVFGQWYAELGQDAVHLLMAPLAFDASTFEMWGALLHGARLAIFPDEMPTPARLSEVIAREQVTTLWLTAGLFHLFAEEFPELFRPLRRVLAGGDVLSPAHVRRVLESCPGLVTVNGYGPTEGTTFTSCHVLRRPDEVPSPVPIGSPLRNTRVRVLDTHGTPVPIGVPGELWIGGDGLARGYHGRPAWTAERFQPDPSGAEPGARLYRTGDQVRWRRDGTLEFLGRVDRQVKLRGYRIELDEIEAVLASHPAVRRAVVQTLPGEPVGMQIVAYVVVAKNAPTSEAMLRWLRERLPEYMVPSRIQVLDAFPLTPSGKVDRHRLPAPSLATPQGEKDVAVPTNETEATLSAIWSDALGLERVGVQEDFFALGGDSIRAILVLSRAHEAGIRLTPRQLFEHRTIAALAAVASSRSEIVAEQGPVTGVLPALPIQRWFLDLDLPHPGHWNMGIRVTAREPLDPVFLSRALDGLLQHHDALRLLARRVEHGWQLELAPPGEPASLRVVEIDPGAPREVVLEHVTAELHGSLDLEGSRVFGAALIRGGGPDMLVLAAHHLVVDAVSWRILLEDLDRAYEHALRGEPTSFPRKTTSVRTWAEALQEHAHSDPARSELGYWLSSLPGASRQDGLHPEGFAEGIEGSALERRLVLDPETTRALLSEAPKASRNETSDFLIAALVEALARVGGDRTLLVDVERHGREPLFEDLDLGRTVGWFTSIVPVRIDLREAEDPGSALRMVKERLRGIPRGGIGHGILRWMGASEDAQRLARLPRATVCLNYLGVVDAMLHGTPHFSEVREAGGPARDPSARRPYRLEITAWVLEGRLNVAFVLGGGSGDFGERLSGEFAGALRGLVAHACAPGSGGVTPSDFPRARVTQQDLDRLLAKIGTSGGGDARGAGRGRGGRRRGHLRAVAAPAGSPLSCRFRSG
jgi:amino acid adenylation domain-containing protein/non-ribosomal peptide synthase protein (TIGR01720 family)